MCNDEMDLSKTVPVENRIARQIGRELTIGLSHDVIDYFKQIGEEVGLPPERVIETCLRQVARARSKVSIHLPVADDEPEPAAVGDSL